MQDKYEFVAAAQPAHHKWERREFYAAIPDIEIKYQIHEFDDDEIWTTTMMLSSRMNQIPCGSDFNINQWWKTVDDFDKGQWRPMMEDPGRPLWHKYDATKTKLQREDLGSDENKTCQ